MADFILLPLVILLLSLIILVLGGVICYFCVRGEETRFHRKKSDTPEEEDGVELVTLGRLDSVRDLQSFNANELLLLPEEFVSARTKVLGSKRISVCFKKTLIDGRKFVGKFYLKSFIVDEADFRRQISVISEIEHPNLVKQIALYSTNFNDLTILSRFMCGGSLASILFDETKKLELNWTRREFIAKGIIKGLRHLHEEHLVPHGNLKASNVLFDDNMNVALGDYGHYALLNDTGKLELATMADVPSFPGDVFCCGLVMIELLTGKPIDNELEECSRIAAAEGEWSSRRAVLNERTASNFPNVESFVDEGIRAQMTAAEKQRIVRFWFTANRCFRPVGIRLDMKEIDDSLFA